jgi:ADP-heptose:LPS heptosyltransferase
MATEGTRALQQPQKVTTAVPAFAPAPRRVWWDLRGAPAALRHLRISARGSFGRMLARLTPTRLSAAKLTAEQVTSVLVCRVNARMGNALFLTPLIQQLHELLPGAAIDVATAYPQAADLLGELPGVRRVIVFPSRGIGLPWRYLQALAQIRAQRYDLAIDPMPNSTSARIVLSLCRARARLGFGSEHQWARLTHAVPAVLMPVHRAIQPVFLLHRALGVPHRPTGLRLRNAGGAREQAQGRALIEQALRRRGIEPQEAQTVGFFAHATGAKSFDRQYWHRFWTRFLQLAPEAVPVEFLPTPTSVPTDARFAALHVRTPQRLAAAMGQMRMFVCADTGPMHLASSTATPTVALFRASQPALYGPLKSCDLALDATRHSPAAMAQLCYEHWLRTRAPARAHA